jgi:hypothetical protein
MLQPETIAALCVVFIICALRFHWQTDNGHPRANSIQWVILSFCRITVLLIPLSVVPLHTALFVYRGIYILARFLEIHLRSLQTRGYGAVMACRFVVNVTFGTAVLVEATSSENRNIQLASNVMFILSWSTALLLFAASLKWFRLRSNSTSNVPLFLFLDLISYSVYHLDSITETPRFTYIAYLLLDVKHLAQIISTRFHTQVHVVRYASLCTSRLPADSQLRASHVERRNQFRMRVALQEKTNDEPSFDETKCPTAPIHG